MLQSIIQGFKTNIVQCTNIPYNLIKMKFRLIAWLTSNHPIAQPVTELTHCSNRGIRGAENIYTYVFLSHLRIFIDPIKSTSMTHIVLCILHPSI